MARAKASANKTGNKTGKELDVYKGVDAETAEPIDVPDMPGYLEDLPATAAIWDAVWRSGGIAYTESDAFLIERYVHLQGQRYQIIARLGGELTSKGTNGTMVLHPLIRRLSDIEGKLNPLEDRLGLSPEARARLGLSAPGDEDPLKEFFAAPVDAQLVE